MEEKHLFLLVHGLGGNPRHLKSLENALVEQLERGVLVHVAQSNSGFNTMDGAVIGANRIVTELLQLLAKLADEGIQVVQISFVGYSFGGVISRYAIGLLEELNFFDIVEPCIFATFATPHVGSVFPSRKFKYRALNFLGSQMLGLTGSDLFCTNNLLNDLADPSLDYYTGLKRFKHHYIFANAVWDRTVPFWTSYLSTKNPFKVREHMDLRYFDHLHGQSVDNLSTIGKVPFLVDMMNSKYVYNANEPSSGLTAVEKRQRVLLMFLFPIFAPVLIILLTAGTLYAHARYGFVYRNKSFEHPVLLETFKEALKKGRSKSSRSDLTKLKNKFNEDLADLAGEAMEDMLLDTTNVGYGNGNIKASQITKGPPKPATSLDGLVNDSPWELDISEQTRQNINNLNKIKWQKYAVKLLHFNAHAEIVDRRKAGNQGYRVMKFFASLAQQAIANDAKERLI